MPASLLDMFPPEVQTLLATAAGLVAVVGLVFWLAGIKIARLSAAVLLGFVAAGAAAWGLPGPTGIAPLTAALLGFVAGLLTGAVTFRFLQGILLACCVGVAACGVYYRTQVSQATTPSPVAASRPVEVLPAKDLLIAASRIPEAPPAAATRPAALDADAVIANVQTAAADMQRSAAQHWQAIAPVHRQHMTLIALLTFAIGLVLALFFPRHTTWIITAALGAALLALAAYALLQVYAPQYQSLLPAAPLPRYGLFAALTLTGMLLQRLLFWPRRKKPAPAPAPAA